MTQPHVTGSQPVSHTCVLMAAPLPWVGTLSDDEVHLPLSFLLGAVQFE